MHQGQLRAIELIKGPAKYVTVVAPRQSGKSFLAMNVCLYWSINNPNTVTFWAGPTFSQVKRPFEELLNVLAPSGLLESANKSDFELKLKNGSKIAFKSVERASNLRGATIDFLVVDEAAYMDESVWKAVLRPMLLVRGQKSIFISTPNGAGWFKEMYDLGQSTEHPDYASTRMHYTDNPIIDYEEIARAKATLPAKIFAAEYEGSFEDSGRKVFDLSNAKFADKWPSATGRVYCAVDLGRANDFTVATFMNDRGEVIDVYRENSRDWADMVHEIVLKARRYSASILYEANSMGDVVGEMIRKQWNDTTAFVTTNKSKQEIIEGLILDLNEGTITLPSKGLFEPLQFELEIYEWAYSPKTRAITYNAPSPFHDDCVMSLAMCNYHRKQKKAYGQYKRAVVSLRD